MSIENSVECLKCGESIEEGDRAVRVEFLDVREIASPSGTPRMDITSFSYTDPPKHIHQDCWDGIVDTEGDS